MNYYPYYQFPVQTSGSTGLFRNIFRNLNLSSILSGTQKTLNFVNQTIPIIKQTGPIIKNAKSMFKVMNEFKKVDDKKIDNIKTNRSEIKKEEEITPSYSSNPTFFL